MLLDVYPIPRVEDLFAKLAGGKSYSQLDLSQAYQQLELDEDSMNYVVINTHKGLFRFNRLPFGVSSTPGIFQCTMESLLHDIPSVVVYLDDILITGRTDAEHIETLDKVLTRLEESGLRLKRSKCVFMAQSVVYLGHRIDQEGLHPTEDKLKAVQDVPNPRNVAELRSYLGLLAYYSKFLLPPSTPCTGCSRSHDHGTGGSESRRLSKPQSCCCSHMRKFVPEKELYQIKG